MFATHSQTDSINTFAPTIVTSFVAIFFIVLSFFQIFETPYLTSTDLPQEWFAIIHTELNTYVQWHPGPLAKILALQFQHWAVLFCFSQAIALTIGMYWLLSFYQQTRFLRAIIALLTTSVFVLLIGFDFILWGTVACIPLVAFTLLQSLTTGQNENTWKIFCIVTVVLLTLSGLQCSIVSLWAALLLAYAIKKDRFPKFPFLRSRNDTLVLCCCFLPWIVLACSAPLPDFPNYSPLGHIVPDDGLPGNILPLFGPTSPIPTMERLVIKEVAAPFVWLLLLLCVVCTRTRNVVQKGLLALLLLLTLDCLAPEWISQISPVATLQRVWPWIFYFPVSLVLVLVSILFLPLCLANEKKLFKVSLMLFAFILLPLLLHSPTVRSSRGSIGLLFPPIDTTLKQSYQIHKRQEKSSFTQLLEKTLVSPSHAVLKKTGVWPLSISSSIRHWKFSSLLREQPHLQASTPGVAPLSNLNDRDLATRWSPGGGEQKGDEWIYVHFRESMLLLGLELATGGFHTDFARGIRIAVGQECIEQYDATKRDTLTTVYEEPHWEGSIAMTDEYYPYFSGQGGGRIFFTAPMQVHCLLIEQIGQVQGFDWSVAELRVMKYPQ